MRGGRALRLAAAGITAALAGCLDLGTLGQVVFAPSVPGLASDQPWVAMPVGAWLVEGGITPAAISACFSTACRPRAAVALFRAAGPDAERLLAALDDPDTLARELTTPPPAAGRRDPRTRRTGPTVVSVERRREGGFAGLALKMARPDGKGAATGIAMGARTRGGLVVVVIVTEKAETASQILRDVLPHLAAG